jgi:hypothetical protein
MLRALLAFILLVACCTQANAQTLVDDQPDVVPVRVVVVPQVPIFADPSLPARETGLYDLSTVDLLRQVEAVFRVDPRFALIDTPPLEALASIAAAPEQQARLSLAEQGLALGMGSFRSFNLATAVDELSAAIDSFNTTPAPWLAQQSIANAWLYIALAQLELALSQPERSTRHVASARRAMREMILALPATRLDADTYPESTIAIFAEEYAEMLLTANPALILPAPKATWLAANLDAALVVQLGVVIGAHDERSVILRVWDTRTDNYAMQESIPLALAKGSSPQLLDAALSRMRACYQPEFPPPPPVPTDRRRLYLEQGVEVAAYFTSPTRRKFASLGPRTGITYGLSDTASIAFGVSALFGRPDPDGDLVKRLDTVRLSLLGQYDTRIRPRFRLYIGAGPELVYIGRVDATLSYWCKVSEGEILEFDDQRRCDEDDVIRQDPSAQLGLSARVGIGIQISGPLWLNSAIGTAVYTVPFEDRVLDFPLSADMGLALRF